jgi:hypothetical protein
MINITTKHTESAKNEHLDGLLKKTKNKIHSSSLPSYLKKYIDTNLKILLIGNPNQLLKINKEFYSKVKGKNKKRFNSKIRKIFDYDSFTNKKQEYNSYSFADNLKINCCPNCNRQYSITISSKNVDGQLTRPDFDHYFPKSRYPLLSLSFYNLIPSCKICNSTFKGSKEMDLKKHIHPYLDNIVNDFSFEYTPSSKEPNKCEAISIKYGDSEDKERIENTFKLFKIEETYNGHQFIVDQILQLKNSLNDDYLKILTENTYDGIDWSPEEAYTIGFGVNYEDDELYEHPFSKLKRDILTKEEMLSIFKTE